MGRLYLGVLTGGERYPGPLKVETQISIGQTRTVNVGHWSTASTNAAFADASAPPTKKVWNRVEELKSLARDPKHRQVTYAVGLGL